MRPFDLFNCNNIEFGIISSFSPPYLYPSAREITKDLHRSPPTSLDVSHVQLKSESSKSCLVQNEFRSPADKLLTSELTRKFRAFLFLGPALHASIMST